MDTNQQEVPTQKKLKFESDDDLLLLREVAADNPFEDGSRWKLVAVKMRRVIPKPFTGRNLRDRVNKLIIKFEAHFQEWRTRSGKDEALIEWISLLEEVRNLKNDFKGSKYSTKMRETQAGQEMQAELATTCCSENQVTVSDQDVEFTEEPDIEECPPEPVPSCSTQCIMTPQPHTSASVRGGRKRKRRINASVEKYLMKKQAQDELSKLMLDEREEKKLALEERKVALEERKVALEERKWALEERKVALEERKVALEERRLDTENWT